MLIGGFSAYSQVRRLGAHGAPSPSRSARTSSSTWRTLPVWSRRASIPNPVPHADVVTTTTHKTLRGPRGGIILAKANEALEKKLQSLVFPGTQGGPLMHVIAAKAVAFKEALEPEFNDYQQQVVLNAQAMAKTVMSRGYKIVSPAAPRTT